MRLNSDEAECDEEARREEEARKREEDVRRAEAAAERMEELRRELEARREEAGRKHEELLRRAGAALQRVEQLQREEQARRDEEARRTAREAEEAARRQKQARADARRLAFATIAASALLGAVAGRVVYELSRAHDDRRSEAQTAKRTNVPGGGLDAGTELAKRFATALPIPKSGLPGQIAAPCPEGIEEIDGYCWVLWPLTPAQVKSGVCESDDVYEPSAGWCRTHRAGYRPYRGKRRSNNVVDP